MTLLFIDDYDKVTASKYGYSDPMKNFTIINLEKKPIKIKSISNMLIVGSNNRMTLVVIFT